MELVDDMQQRTVQTPYGSDRDCPKSVIYINNLIKTITGFVFLTLLGYEISLTYAAK